MLCWDDFWEDPVKGIKGDYDTLIRIADKMLRKQQSMHPTAIKVQQREPSVRVPETLLLLQSSFFKTTSEPIAPSNLTFTPKSSLSYCIKAGCGPL
ncbi:MAG: hypothetical protein H0U75_07175 [Legionella sp.]|nr:hypothetical protein [Legionella sp.]